MLSRSRWPAFLLLAAAIAFASGMVHLFRLRYAQGDVYPPYSSLRADPLGSKALYDSLDALGGLRVERNYRPIDRLTNGSSPVLLVLGARAGQWQRQPEETFREWEEFVRSGGRLVVAFYPESVEPSESASPFGDRQSGEERARPGEGPADRRTEGGEPGDRTDGADREGRPVSLRERWGTSLAYWDLNWAADEGFETVMARRVSGIELPDAVPWHSALYFDSLSEDWRTIFAREKRPVLVERDLGGGTIVLASDAYHFSNEALLTERQAAVLGWFLGGRNRVIFDETHLGVSRNPGVAVLMRQYRLHGVVFTFLVLAGLFVWKAAVSFVPPASEGEERNDAEAVGGKDVAAGLVNLLRRSVRPPDLLDTCFAQWRASGAPRGREATKLAERMASALEEERKRPAAQRSPVEGYERLRRIRSERNRI